MKGRRLQRVKSAISPPNSSSSSAGEPCGDPAAPLQAASLGYEVIDLDPDFFRRHAAHAQRFEYAHDGHWNETGHAVAAKAVLASKLVERLIGQQPGP
jgi:hypothetical protein